MNASICKALIRAAAVSSLTWLCASSAVAADITLKAITYMPPSKFEDSMAVFKSWIEKVKEQSGGKVDIKIVGGPEVFPVNDQVNAGSKGLVDIVLTFTAHAPAVPEVETIFLSKVTPQQERENGYTDLFDKAHHKINMKYIGRASTNSGFYIFSRKPIHSLEDFKGMKIRSHTGYNPFFSSLGANPVGIGISEIYGALERGLVDAAPYNLFVHDMGIAEVTKYVLDDPFWKAHTTMILMNKQKFDSLPADAQKALIDAQIENEAEMAGIVAEMKTQERKKLEEAGITFTKLSDEEAKEWERLSVDVRFDDLKDKLPPEQLAKIKTMLMGE